MQPPADPPAHASLSHRCACGYPLRNLGAGRCPECGRTIATASAAPIAQYRERTLARSREFTLYPDKVIIRGARRFGDAYVLAVAPANLDPHPSVFWRRSQALKPGFTLFITSIGFIIVFLIGHLARELAPAVWISIVAGAVGLISMLVGLRRTEYARFHALGRPEVIALDVGRVGPDAARFDEFVAAICSSAVESRSQPPTKDGL